MRTLSHFSHCFCFYARHRPAEFYSEPSFVSPQMWEVGGIRGRICVAIEEPFRFVLWSQVSETDVVVVVVVTVATTLPSD